MADVIDCVEVHEYSFEVHDMAPAVDTADYRDTYFTFEKGATAEVPRYLVVVKTRDGGRGEYAPSLLLGHGAVAQTVALAPRLLGQDPYAREAIYDDLKHEVRMTDRIGIGPLDIALWDLAGKSYGVPVSQLLGGFRKRLPAYASTYGGTDPGGNLGSKEAYADFALACREMGYRGFKIHGWRQGDRRQEADNLLHLRERVGDDMDLMIDCYCRLRTFADALYVGRACDEAEYFWYEDPYRDSGTSAFGHAKLRELISTPLLITEHLRGVEPKADFLLAGGTDFLRADLEADMGITGVMKIAHFAEALGVDVEIHLCGPAARHAMSAIRNSNYYEMALVGPEMDNIFPPPYTGDYSDQLESIGPDGCVAVPDGPGLGVSYDWHYIERKRIHVHTFKV